MNIFKIAFLLFISFTLNQTLPLDAMKRNREDSQDDSSEENGPPPNKMKKFEPKTDFFKEKEPIPVPENAPIYEKIAVWARRTWVQNKFKRCEEENFISKLFQSKDFVPLLSVWGGINYGMTIEKMKDKIKETFTTLKNNNLIITQDAFQQIKDQYYIRSCPNTDLTRIWGSNFLRSKINESEPLREIFEVPEYVIVLKDLDKVSVKIGFYNNVVPTVSELINSAIYFKKINGEQAASWAPRCEDLYNLTGFYDFSDPGNIIFDQKNKKYFIVDTEFKSFQLPFNGNPLYKQLMTDNECITLEYAYYKFRYLNNQILSYDYEFSLSEN